MRQPRFSAIGWLSMMAGVLAAAGPAAAATFTVQLTADLVDTAPGDGQCQSGPGPQSCTLRAAVQEANALPGPDEIMVPPGDYALTIDGPFEDDSATGDLDVTGPLTIRAANRLRPVVRSAFVSIERVLHVRSAAVKVRGLVIRDGRDNTVGAGIRVEPGAELELSRAVLTENRIKATRGAIFNAGTLTVIDSLISSNVALTGAGGVTSSGTLVIRGSTMDNNSGAALAVTGGTARIVDSTFSGSRGPAVVNNGGDVHLASVTIANTTTNTGALYNFSGTIRVKNTIAAGTRLFTGEPGQDCGGTVISEGYNVIGVAGSCSFMSTTGDQVGTPSAPIDPLLGPLADNAGPTTTHALLPGSPALDRANPAGCSDAAGQLLPADQRGAPRVMEGDGVPPVVCDTGAYEHGALITHVPIGHFGPWINELWARGITSGCSASPPLFCPDDPVSRAQMAVFLVVTFGL